MALTPITAAPTSISAERWAELTSSTPASFSDIPPVLRWEDDASIELASPVWTAWGPNAGSSSGSSVSGRLYVTEEAVSFLPSPAAQLPGFALPFPALTLHALTPAGGERPAHIYCQLDESAVAPGANGAAPVEDEEEYAELGEMRVFVPADKLDGLFSALSACSALHDSLLPSGEPASFFGFGGGDDDDDDDDEGEWDDDEGDDGAFDDAEDGAAGGAGGRDTTQEPAADDAEGDGDDAVSAFLAKVDWSRATPAGAATGEWVDVAPGDEVDFGTSELASLRAANAELTRSLATEQAAHATARARVRELEKELQRVKKQVQVRAERVMGAHMAAPAPEGPL